MNRFFAIIFFITITSSVLAQEEDVKDSVALAQAPAVADSLILKDTVRVELVSLPYNLDYIPADDAPELIADRLSCIQRTIALPYNKKVHAFIEYFTVRDR